MNDTEKLEIRDIFRIEMKELNDSFKTVEKRIDRMDQTVYGSDGESGLRQAVVDHGKDIEGLKTFRTQVKTVVVTILPVAQGAVTFVALWVKSLFSGK